MSSSDLCTFTRRFSDNKVESVIEKKEAEHHIYDCNEPSFRMSIDGKEKEYRCFLNT